MRYILVLFILSMGLFWSPSSKAFYLHIAAQPNYSGLGALTVGTKEWEVGQLARFTYGFNRVFRFDEKYFSSFGFALTPPSSPGFFASLGFDYDMAWGLGLRGELYAVVGISGYMDGAGNLGISWNF